VDRDKIYGFLGTLIFHLVVLLILGFTVLRSIVPEEEEGVLVNFGTVDAAAGTFEPRYSGGTLPRQAVQPSVPQPQPVQEEIITQDIEESIALTQEKKREERRREEERRRAEEQRKQEETINSRVAGAFGMGSSESNNQGEATNGAGNQGSPFGNADRGQNEGVSINLNGRALRGGELPLPTYTVQEEGKIVINITVDPKGNVIFAEIGVKGTNIDNASMRQSALEAARRARFNSITGTNNQSGQIIYNYKLTQ
jgi:TonB family protein